MGLPRGMWLVVGLMLAPACTCVGWGSSSPDCNLALSEATCPPNEAAIPPHVVDFTKNGFVCEIVCAPGFFDCDGIVGNGCESTTGCWSNGHDGGGAITTLQRLSDVPGGLALCGGELVYIDGTRLLGSSTSGDPPRTIALLGAPAGGIACDGDFAYLPLRTNNSTDPNGRVVRFALKESGAVDLETMVDPARSIDLDDAGHVYWIARSDAGTFVTESALDASPLALLPVDEPRIDKTFALFDGLWAIADGDLRHALEDGAVDIVSDANAVAITARASGISVFVGIDGGVALGDASVLDARALASWGDDVFVATGNSIVHITPTGSPSIIASGLAHVVDLAVDARYLYFTTVGPETLSRAPW